MYFKQLCTNGVTHSTGHNGVLSAILTFHMLQQQAHREGGVAGASAPGPGDPKGARRAPQKI